MTEEEKLRTWGKGRAPNIHTNIHTPSGTGVHLHFTIRLGDFDQTELDFIGETLNTNKSEAVRTAIRVYAALLRNRRT